MVSQAYPAHVPVYLEVPGPMDGSVREVLAGEYEAGYSGEGLTILDIGANIGAFSVWAHMRWPGSRIHAYEPQPDTFAILQRNCGHRPGIECHNLAVSQSPEPRARFWSSHPGDGEAGLEQHYAQTFPGGTRGKATEVAVVHPGALPQADVVKVDVEGAEAEILLGMDLTRTTLVLLEFQNDRNREAIKRGLAGSFRLEAEDAVLWDELVEGYPEYHRQLAGDHWGHMRFVNRDASLARLRRDVVRHDPVSLSRRIARRLLPR